MAGAPSTINIVAAALGGQGGGVFTNWLIDVAQANDWAVQTTSLAGVAQRTGATIYYIEMIPKTDQQAVMSLFPSQGDIDIAICSEIAEAGRMLQRGFITADRTTLVTSTNRVFSIIEKIGLADSTIDPDEILDLAQRYAKQFVGMDMQAIADKNKSVISAVMLGALAGSGALPFSQQSFADAIKASGKGVDASLAAFNAAFKVAAEGQESTTDTTEENEASTAELPNVDGFPLGDFPAAAQPLIALGIERTRNYQDADYAHLYLDKLKTISGLDNGDKDYELTQLTARYLALWMCFEDVPRVAQLKLREQRLEEVRREVGATSDQIFYVTEYFAPRVEEMCAVMPAKLGAGVMNSALGKTVLGWFTGGKKLRTNTVSVNLALRFLAWLRKFRRDSLGYQHEHRMIDAWLTAIVDAAPGNPELACELARCGRLVKGYGDTRHRTSQQLLAIVEAVNQQSITTAEKVSELREAALADDSNQQFQAALKP